MDILSEIVNKRRNLVREKGYEMGISLPRNRTVPLNSFVKDPFLICEVKRKSPSRGNISVDLDAQKQAELYYSRGIRSVSVLTEQNYFAGSLSDLVSIKQAFPDLAVLRKDFLFSTEDIDVSYRAGADAVLLIASILSVDELRALYKKTRELGMEALVEVHGKEDIIKAEQVKPTLTGINSRDLVSFRVDLTIPLSIKQMITWKTDLVFESGIHFQENALLVLGSGFRGILVGEAVVRNPSLIDELLKGYSLPGKNFWERLYKRKKPFVKICGMTNSRDAYYARDCGADILGFIFAPSKRRTEPSLLEELKDLNILKVGVVVTEKGTETLDPRVKDLLDNGLLDAIQFHGDEKPERCYHLAFPYYKALQLKDINDVDRIAGYRCPRVLVDAFSGTERGGTGKNIPEEYLFQVKKRFPLWIAGGLGPDNVGEVVKRFSPELIDASTRLEESPGKKNPELVARFIQQIKG
ncbi:MAG: bifunctional indole-3-glycerol phosphate synthase/phosphoribosylanthranilate isomerase [Spirochaetales bacterium]|nr:bifunctional indole-3-glycerol phosphate synthase/phosphoribosylanthranilate isomerase [Spirochaetales bacterium]